MVNVFKCVTWNYSTVLLRKSLRKYNVRSKSEYRSTAMGDSVFIGKRDHYKGIIVNSIEEPCVEEDSDLPMKLENSLKKWAEEGVRGVWFNVAIEHAFWVPVLAKNGFTFHHGEGSLVTMCRWLPKNEESGIPKYAHTMAGAGAIVINEKKEILVVSERYSILNLKHWKLPGGYIEPGETIADAAIREVFEETGVEAQFETLVAFRHSQKAAFGCSDIYFIVELSAKSERIKKCDREIEDCQWMPVDEFLTSSLVLENNKMVVQNYLDCHKAGIKIKGEYSIHRLAKRPQTIFMIDSEYLHKNDSRIS